MTDPGNLGLYSVKGSGQNVPVSPRGLRWDSAGHIITHKNTPIENGQFGSVTCSGNSSKGTNGCCSTKVYRYVATGNEKIKIQMKVTSSWIGNGLAGWTIIKDDGTLITQGYSGTRTTQLENGQYYVCMHCPATSSVAGSITITATKN